GLAGGGGTGYLLTQHYDIDAGSAHSTTIGLLLGVANGALLIEPANYHDASSVFGLLTLGSAVGAAGGFAYGQAAELTSGHAPCRRDRGSTWPRAAPCGTSKRPPSGLAARAGGWVSGRAARRLACSPRGSVCASSGSCGGALAGGLVPGLIGSAPARPPSTS